MKAEKVFFIVDTHTQGEPTRIVVGGVPQLQGRTVLEKASFFSREYDHYRRAIVHEPRGHKDMFAALIVEPSGEADVGAVFLDSRGYLNMCGHGSIGVATVVVEIGLVEVQEPITTIKIETPAGVVEAKVEVRDGRAYSVKLIGVPSFLYKEDVNLYVDSIGEVKVDIAFGGNFFALVESEQLGVELKPQNASRAFIGVGTSANRIRARIETITGSNIAVMLAATATLTKPSE